MKLKKGELLRRAGMGMLALGLFLGGGNVRVSASTDGIYADFTTSMGDFTCNVDYQTAPKAVANFVGLATGERRWIDGARGQVRTNRFYDGLTFHRVIAGFMIQGGSPAGTGSDGPGFAFPDEFNASVRHDSAGVLSSANSGPDSNGAQFFVTVVATPWLDDVHTIFGRVTSGQTVVNAINGVATDANDKPLTPVIVQSVVIRRVGAAANAFDIHGQNLPVVSTVPLSIAAGNGEVSVSYSRRQYAGYRFLASTDLSFWSEENLGIELESSTVGTVTRAMDGPAGFYAVSEVRYPSSTFCPRTVENRALAMTLTGLGVLRINFDGEGSGSYNFADANFGTLDEYTWTQDPYRGFLWPVYFSGLVPMTIRLDFTSEAGGTLSGTAFTSPTTSLRGSFTLSGP